MGPPGWTVCLPKPTSPLAFTTATNLRTSDSDLCLDVVPASWISAGQPDACFVVASDITITSALSVTGARPLVLVASETIQIKNSVIDIASHTMTSRLAAGAPFSGCRQPIGPTGTSGGAGGSFGSKGGDGGRSATSPTTPGAAVADSGLTSRLRAGCDGGAGGAPVGQVAGAPGRGGGALYVLAGANIVFDGGDINASGAGGSAFGLDSAGGGGGSGGMIVLVASSIGGSEGSVMANGGGGAGGGVGGMGGVYGTEPTSPFTAARGGNGTSGSGAGGDGYAGTFASTNGGNAATGAGGGGGGGAGYIATSGDVAPHIRISPTPTALR